MERRRGWDNIFVSVVRPLPRISFGTEHHCRFSADSSNLCSLHKFVPHITKNLSRISSPSCCAVCGHHPYPSIAIVSSLLCKISSDIMPPSFPSHILLSNTFFFPRIVQNRHYRSLTLVHFHRSKFCSSSPRLLGCLFLISGGSNMRPSTLHAVHGEGGIQAH